MRCLELQQWMSLKLDGQLPAADERAFDAHLAECPACALEWQQWLQIENLFRGAEMARPPEDLTARVMESIRPRPRRGAFAASLLVMGVGLIVLASVLVLPVLINVGLAVVAAVQSPGAWPATAGMLKHCSAVLSTIVEGLRLFLWGVLRSPSLLVAVLYAGVALATVVAWLRVAVFRKSPAEKMGSVA